MMRRSKSVNVWVLCGCCLPLLGSACGGSPDASSTSNGGSGGIGGGAAGAAGAPIENPCGMVDATLADADANALFGTATIPTFELTLPAEQWTALQKNARDEQFVLAQACFEGKAVGQVGLRFKGSYGSLFNCFDAAGVNTCRKLGMKLKFDYVDAGQRFFGLKRLNFQSYRWDESYMKERLSYDLYREMGIPAPRASFAKLVVNGDPQGLFGMVEEIDGRFTQDRWPDNGNGNLYKEVWPSHFEEATAKSQLKTNEDVGDVSSYATFAAELAAAPESELRTTLSHYMDLDYWARYMAVDDAIANFDGIITYYTSGAAEEAGNDNFYIYEDTPGH
ncbi:MAG TPA: CotH kinase family protein, partial [Polyangiaceae bacterium]